MESEAARAASADSAGSAADAVDAVAAAIPPMEDAPLFNAGRGAVFTSEASVELDASIMDGATLDAGAVAEAKLEGGRRLRLRLQALERPGEGPGVGDRDGGAHAGAERHCSEVVSGELSR